VDQDAKVALALVGGAGAGLGIGYLVFRRAPSPPQPLPPQPQLITTGCGALYARGDEWYLTEFSVPARTWKLVNVPFPPGTIIPAVLVRVTGEPLGSDTIRFIRMEPCPTRE
jgi:hypothetical protein